jgi:rhodanese-related sulfurtransferase
MFGFLKSPAQDIRLTPAQIVEQHRQGAITVVDVRDISELKASGTASGGVHAPLMLLQAKADPQHPEHDKRLNPNDPIALFCASGARSGMAAAMLQRLGYKQVHNVGGFGDWVRAGGQVARV